MKNIPIVLPGFRPFRPLAIRSVVQGGYSEVPALLIAARQYESDFIESTESLVRQHAPAETAAA